MVFVWGLAGKHDRSESWNMPYLYTHGVYTPAWVATLEKGADGRHHDNYFQFVCHGYHCYAVPTLT